MYFVLVTYVRPEKKSQKMKEIVFKRPSKIHRIFPIFISVTKDKI